MKITALVTIESPPAARPSSEPFVVVYDLFKPEDAVEAIRRHVAGQVPMPFGDSGYWSATRVGRDSKVHLHASTSTGDEIHVHADVQVLSRFTQSVSCPSCDATWVWSALQSGTEQDPLVVREAEAVGCDECGWIVSDHPVAGRPSVQPLDDQVEISRAGS